MLTAREKKILKEQTNEKVRSVTNEIVLTLGIEGEKGNGAGENDR